MVIHLEIFADEIGIVRNPSDNTQWMYIGMLFVPVNNKHRIIQDLLNLRCVQHGQWNCDENNCPYKCGYHQWNDTEIHYTEVHRSNARFRIACRWLHEFLINANCIGNLGLVRFEIMGLNLSNMHLNYFGLNRERTMNVYNRFFRTALKRGSFNFFGHHNQIIIDEIYHDTGSQEEHERFPWYTGYRINLDPNDRLQVANPDIIFIDSDHRIYPDEHGVDFREESQLIQFIDIILGSSMCCLHNLSRNERKREVAYIIKPLLQRLLGAPRNPNSQYHYYRRMEVSFFPKTKIAEPDVYQQMDVYGNWESIERYPDNFYTNRPCLLPDRGQMALGDF